jgi:membrane-associated phospholipid phosphatase
MLAATHTVWWLAAYALVAGVCWSRVVLGHHSTARTVGGVSLGASGAAPVLLVQGPLRTHLGFPEPA